jgi:hypothetical protein
VNLSLALSLSTHSSELANSCPLAVDPYSLDSPHTKALLLLQAHFSRLQLPCSDYLTDLKSVLDQTIRILQVSSVNVLIDSIFIIRICAFKEGTQVGSVVKQNAEGSVSLKIEDVIE